MKINAPYTHESEILKNNNSPNDLHNLSSFVLAASKGSKSAETKLLKVCQPIIRKQLKQLASQDADVDDLMQESMIVLLKQIRNRKLKDPKKVIAYVRSIAKYQFFMECRKRKRLTTYIADIDIPQDVGTNCPQHKQLAFRQSLRNTWQELNVARDKSLLVDVFATRATKDELVIKYCVKPAHFDRIVHRARKRFMKTWQQEVAHEAFS